MTEKDRPSSEELIAHMYDLIIKQRVALLRQEDRSLTEQQAVAQAFREHPQAYEAQIAVQQMKQMKQGQ